MAVVLNPNLSGVQVGLPPLRGFEDLTNNDFNINTYKNKYLDGEGIQKLWQRTKEQIAAAAVKIIPINLTDNSSITITSSSTVEADKLILETLANMHDADIMIQSNNQNYYYSHRTSESVGYWINVVADGLNQIKVELTWNSSNTAVTQAKFTKSKVASIANDAIVSIGQKANSNNLTVTKADGTTATVKYTPYISSPNGGTRYLVASDLSIVGSTSGGGILSYDTETATFKNDTQLVNITGNAATADALVTADGQTLITPEGLVAIAEGKTKAYTIYAGNQSSSLYVSGSETFKSTADSITLSNTAKIKVSSNTDVEVAKLNIGDIIFLVDEKYPDRWVGTRNSSGTVLYAIEGKTDLTGYQPLDADLTAIAGLTGGGLLKRNSDNTWSLDTTAYAGGTAVTLNSTSKAGSTASFYAPTAAGTANQVLISNGSNKAPTWTSQGNITAGKVGKSISFTDNDWTIKDGPSYDGSEAIVVTADDVGAVPIKHTGSPYSGHIGYSGNTPKIYTSNADGDTLSLIGVGNNLIALAVGESYFEITADSITFKENKIVDYSMTLTTGEIDTILANS